MAAVSTNDLKRGMSLDLPDGLFQVVDFQHVKPGKGGAFVRTKLKRVVDGASIDKTFRAGEKFRAVRTEACGHVGNESHGVRGILVGGTECGANL